MISLLTLALFLTIKLSPTMASEEINVVLNGRQMNFDEQAPIMKNDRVLVPLREIFEGMGADVHWDASDMSITSTLSDQGEKMRSRMQINSHFQLTQYMKGEMEKQEHILKIDQTPILYNNKTMIPLRAAAESFGYHVSWNLDSYTVTLDQGTSLLENNRSFKQYNYISSDTYVPNDQEFETFFLTNIERENHQLAPFTLSASLSAVAHKKSENMLNKEYFSHTSPDYGTPFDMMATFGIDFRMAAENIAAGYATEESVVEGWMNSDGHRKNILNPSLSTIGIGFVNNPNARSYSTYWTQMFITP